MEARGRGRGYGRARGQSAGEPGRQQSAPQRPGSSQQAGGGAPQQGAWVRPQQVPAWGVRPPAPPSAEQTTSGVVSGGGGGDVPMTPAAGGSSVRGRVVNKHDIMILMTKPQHISDKKGSTGKVINLTANFMELLSAGKWSLYQYRVDFAPDIDGRRQRRFLLKTAAQDVFHGGYIFDGTVVFTAEKLDQENVEKFAKTDDDQNIRVTIKLVQCLEWGQSAYIQVFNLIVRNLLKKLRLQEIGRNYFCPERKIVLDKEKIELWPGYFTSMRQYEQKLLLNVDLQFKFLRTDTVYSLLLDCRGHNVQQEFRNRIVGTIVLTSYNNKTYRIDDVDFAGNPQHKFTLKDGKQISYMEYFKEKYKLNIADTRQPLLISMSKPREIRAGMPEKVVLIPEFCRMTGLTDQQRENFTLMKTLDGYTKVGPEGRVRELTGFAQQINSNQEAMEQLRRWDLKLAQRLIQLSGRVYAPEMMSGGKNLTFNGGADADWARNSRDKPMLTIGNMSRPFVVITPSRLVDQTKEFMQKLVNAARGMGFNLSQYQSKVIRDDNVQSYLNEVENVFNSVNPTIILVVLTNNNNNRYAAIKKKCYVDKGLPSQMIVGRNLTSKGAMTIATKIAIQINCKIGGVPWTVQMPLSGLMVVGYDVSRDTVNKKKSFGGMVASLDKYLTQYFSEVREHALEEELSNHIGTFMVLACKEYFAVNKTYPDRILIYRDGVGLGQLPYVKDHEVSCIKKSLKEHIYKDKELKLAFIVVSKRINAKLFNGSHNPPPGTVVDDVITLPEFYDFYLVSQCVREGTVSPTHYNVIEDTINLPPDRLQLLTYKMTHLYYNSQKTIRVPAPCQYAHKLSFLHSQYLHCPAHRDLKNRLYYL